MLVKYSVGLVKNGWMNRWQNERMLQVVCHRWTSKEVIDDEGRERDENKFKGWLEGKTWLKDKWRDFNWKRLHCIHDEKYWRTDDIGQLN